MVYLTMENKRLNTFKSYENHAWLKKVYLKLKKQDVELAINFLIENAELDKGSFEIKMNRMFLGLNAPKNAGRIQELLSCSNS